MKATTKCWYVTSWDENKKPRKQDSLPCKLCKLENVSAVWLWLHPNFLFHMPGSVTAHAHTLLIQSKSQQGDVLLLNSNRPQTTECCVLCSCSLVVISTSRIMVTLKWIGWTESRVNQEWPVAVWAVKEASCAERWAWLRVYTSLSPVSLCHLLCFSLLPLQ